MTTSESSVDSLFENVHRLVHLDLKGAPPKLNYLDSLFAYLKQVGATGLLVEYEDMFPYMGDIKIISRPNCYSPEDVGYIQALAGSHNLEVIPLIQTFGHLEFVLKHNQFRHLREMERYPNVLCPSRVGSMELVEKMLTQVLHLHPQIQWIHIGADEVWHLAQCSSCQKQLDISNLPKNALFFSHVSSVARFIKSLNPKLRIIIWDDMFRSCNRQELLNSGLGKLVEPMVWNYMSVGFFLPPSIWHEYSEVFSSVWIATAFKGASGVSQCIPNTKHHIHNHLNWIEQIMRFQGISELLRGFALTGWQRYDHYSVLCELLPAGIPSLVVCLQTLIAGSFNDEVHKLSSALLGLPSLFNLDLHNKPLDVELGFSFPGSQVFINISTLVNTKLNLERLTKSESFLGWFSPFNISRVYANPLQVEQIRSTAKEVADNLNFIRLNLKTSLSIIYDDGTVNEWLSEHVDTSLSEVDKILNDAQILIEAGARPHPLSS